MAEGMNENDVPEPQEELIFEEPTLQIALMAIPRGLARCGLIPPGAKAVYLAIISHADGHADRTAWPGYATLARETGMTERSVSKWVKWLRDHEMLTYRRMGFGKQNQYVVRPYPTWLQDGCLKAPKKQEARQEPKSEPQPDRPPAPAKQPVETAIVDITEGKKFPVHSGKNFLYDINSGVTPVIKENNSCHKGKNFLVSNTSRRYNRTYRDNIDSSLIQQQINARRSRVKNKGGDEEKSAAAENKKQNLFALLVALGINSPLREKVLEKSTLEEFRACALYTTTLEKVRNPYLLAARWVAQDECAPPQEFVALARASVEEIVAEEKWAGLWTSPEHFPWRLWFTDWESVRPAKQQDEFVEAPGARIPTPTPAESLWHAALRKIRVQVPRVTFRTWFEDTRALGLEEGTLVVAAISQQQAAWLETKFQNRVSKILTELAGEPTGVRFVAREDSHEIALPGIR